MLVLGFGTRFAALGLMIITALIQVYVLPEALWSVHVYWAAILMVLLSRGPGPISVDHMIRLFTQRER
jgi:putative oxidoreductase